MNQIGSIRVNTESMPSESSEYGSPFESSEIPADRYSMLMWLELFQNSNFRLNGMVLISEQFFFGKREVWLKFDNVFDQKEFLFVCLNITGKCKHSAKFKKSKTLLIGSLTVKS